MYQVQRKRKRRGLYFLILFLCAFAIGMGIGYGGVKMNLWQQETEAVPEQSPQDLQPLQTKETPAPDKPASVNLVTEAEPLDNPESSYFVVEEAGRVCVFTVDETGQMRFSHNLSIELDDLRPEDRQLFATGIRIETKQELLALMEDFGS